MMGFASPTVIPLVADEAKGFFAGNFLWAIVFGVASIALIIILFFLNRKSKKDRNAGKK